MLIGIAHQRVVTQDKECLNRIGVTAHHRPKHVRRIGHVTTHYDICIRVAPHLFGWFFKHFRHTIRVYGVIIIAKLLGFLLSRQLLMKSHLRFWDIALIEPAKGLTTGYIQVARHRS